MPIAVVVLGAGATAMYKNNSAAPTAGTSPTQNAATQRSYDQNSPALTDAEINALVKAASVEPPAYADEEKDSLLITSDNQALNNFNNAYVSTDF